MAPRTTRSKPLPSADTAPSVPSAPKLQPADSNPPHIFLLPQNASKNARFVTLVNPATQNLERYFYCPNSGIYELKKISAATNATPRSLLLADKKQATAYVLKEAYILTATKFDPVFLLLPLFEAIGTQSKGMARTEEDHFETLAKTSPHMAALLRREGFRALLRARLAVISELADAMGEEAYRLDVARLCGTLRRKLDMMIQSTTWPASLEDQHVRMPLEAPAMSIRPVNTSHLANGETALPDSQTADEGADKSAVNSNHSSLVTTEEIRNQARLRTALDLLLHSYVPRALHSSIRAQLASPHMSQFKLAPLDFKALENHLSSIAKVRAENQALRTLSDNISRKRATADDDEAAEIRAEKKRKKEEEELKKKNESRAVKQLKKVDTSGMKKLSSFFGAKAAAKG